VAAKRKVYSTSRDVSVSRNIIFACSTRGGMDTVNPGQVFVLHSSKGVMLLPTHASAEVAVR
jgi:hypothetical protein